jgi:hypothetical protein
MILVIVVEDRSDHPHLQIFGESISLDNPSLQMLDMFHSLARKYNATVEVNGKEWRPDGEDNQTS